MRWKPPQHGDVRIVKRFAFFPIEISYGARVMKIIKYLYNNMVPPGDKILLGVIIIGVCWVLFVVSFNIYKQCNSPKKPNIVEKEKIEILKEVSEEDKLEAASHEQMVDMVQWTYVYKDRKNYEITNKISGAICSLEVTKKEYYEIKELVDKIPASSYQLQDIKEWNKKYPEINRIISDAIKDGEITNGEYWEIVMVIDIMQKKKIKKLNK